MRNLFVIRSTLLLLFILPGSLYAQNYYVCNQGANTNLGISPSEPWATFDYAMSKFGSLNAGDAILFCRNGTFTSSYPKLYNPRCKSTAACTIGDYIAPNTTANPKAPVIQANIGVNGAIRFEDGGNADHDEGYILKNLTLKGNGTGYGIFLYNDVDYLVADSLTIDHFGIGIYSAAANTPNTGANQVNENIILRNSTITNNASQGWLGGCNNCLIDNNKFINNGFAKAIYNHNIYIAGKNNNGITVSNNTLYKSAVVTGKCSGTSLVVHGVASNLTIEGNTVYEDFGKARSSCWGISVDPGYTSEEFFANVKIINNTVTNVGNVGIGCASCTDVQITGNKIAHSQDFSFIGIGVPHKTEDTVKSDRVSISDNIIDLIDPNNRGKIGIKAPTTEGFTIGLNTITLSK